MNRSLHHRRVGQAGSPSPPAAPTEAHMEILRTIRRIPPGAVATYGGVARVAGLPGRARLVGYVLRASPLAADLPWHRVVGASGRISDRPGGGPSEQRCLLEAEGVEFIRDNRVNIRTHLWAECHDGHS